MKKSVMAAIYRLSKIILRIFFMMFYRYKQVIGEEKTIPLKSSFVISNHPSMVYDPLHPAVECKQQFHFWAKYSLFKNPFLRWFFTTFYCIPIQRPKDMDDMSKTIDNATSFEQSIAHLKQGDTIYSAPEGTSYVYWRLRPLKTGVARVALLAQQHSNWQLDLQIMPCGLHYFHPRDFRTDILVQFGDAVRTKHYQALYEKNPQEAIDALTHDLFEQLKKLVLHTENELEANVLRGALAFFDDGKRSKQLILPRFEMAQKLAANIHKMAAEQRELLENLHANLFVFFKKTKTLGLKEYDLRVENPAQAIAYKAFFLLLTLPIFLFGSTQNALAFGIPYLVAQKMNLYEGYQATVKGLVGLVLVPLCYFLQSYIVFKVSQGNIVLTLAYGLLLFPCGIFVFRYQKTACELLRLLRLTRYKAAKNEIFQDIMIQRKALLAQLKESIMQ